MCEQRLIDANALPMYKVKIVHSFGIVEGSVVFPDDIKKAPTIDAVPVVHGRWIRANDEQAYFDVEYVCSGCQFVVAVSGIGTPILYGYKYCPHCGAKMRGETDEE